MAKAIAGRAALAKVKAPPPGAFKKAKPKGVAPKKAASATTAAKKTASKPAAVATNGRTGKTVLSKPVQIKKATPAKASATKASSAKRLAKKAAAPKNSANKMASSTKLAARKAAPSQRTSATRSPAATPAKSHAVKQVSPRRPATRTAIATPPARRARATVPPRTPPAAKPRRNTQTGSTTAAPRTESIAASQVFVVSHLNQSDFKVDGLRAYARYRDLGIAAATGGLCQAHVIRFTPPCTDEVRKRHIHQADLQLVYVLQGWMKNEFEGHGEQMMSAGSCWLQPSGIRHTVLDYSADCEVLEVIVPADFKTEEPA